MEATRNTKENQRPRWAERVSRFAIGRLYRSDATGLRDDELLDEIGMALYMRVESILTVTDGHRGLIKCWGCAGRIEHKMHRRTGTVIRCAACGWSIAWADYHRSYRRKQLVAGGMEAFFREFYEQYPRARTYPEKMRRIDTLIHRYHWELEGSPGRSGAVNLIGGTQEEVVAFLNELTYGPGGTDGLRETRDSWRKKGRRE
jgi:hypothetical protein